MVFDWKTYDTFLSKYLAEINVINMDFSQEIVWPEATKNHTVDYNGEQNLVVCRTRQDLVYLLQGVLETSTETNNSGYVQQSDSLNSLNKVKTLLYDGKKSLYHLKHNSCFHQ